MLMIKINLSEIILAHRFINSLIVKCSELSNIASLL